MRAAIGHSADIDQGRMVAEAISQAEKGLGGSVPHAGLVMMGGQLAANEILPQITAVFPGIPLVGCSSAGESSSVLNFEDDSLAILLFHAPEIRFATALTRQVAANSDKAAKDLAEQIRQQLQGRQPRLLFLFMNLTLNVSGTYSDPGIVISHLNEAFGHDVPIIGGVAGDYPPFGDPKIFFGGEAITDAAAVLALEGDFDFGMATEISWRPVGEAGVITAASGPLIETIDHEPAIEFYRKRLGSTAQLFVGAPLAIEQENGDLTLRSPFVADETSGAFVVSGGVAVGDRVRISICSLDDVQAGATHVINQAMGKFPQKKPPALAAFISCGARRIMLASEAGDECARIAKRLGPGIPLFGMYGFGEIGPHRKGEPAFLHNQTIIALVMG